jgi:hypothetical protein
MTIRRNPIRPVPTRQDVLDAEGTVRDNERDGGRDPDFLSDQEYRGLITDYLASNGFDVGGFSGKSGDARLDALLDFPRSNSVPFAPETRRYRDVVPVRRNPIRPKSRKETAEFPVRERSSFSRNKETIRYGGVSSLSSGRYLLEVDTLAKLFYLGTVINPKTMRPYFAAAAKDSGDFFIFVPTFNMTEIEVVGRGYLDSGGDYEGPAHRTGMPRVHTPAGIPTAEKASGLGTVLYTAGALYGSYLAAKLQEGAEAEDFPGVDNNSAEDSGISSGYGASESAQKWWRKAVQNGLAYEEEGDEEEESKSGNHSYTKTVSVDVSEAFDGERVNKQIEQAVEDDVFSDAIDAAGSDGDHYEDVHETYVRGMDYTLSDVDVQLIFDVSIDVAFELEDGSQTTDTVTFTVEKDVTLDDIMDRDDVIASLTESMFNSIEEENQTREHDPERWASLVLLGDEKFDAAVQRYAKETFDDSPPVSYAPVMSTLVVDNLRTRRSRYEIDVDVRARVSGTVKVKGDSIFGYPVRNALRAGLILDVTPGLREDALEGRGQGDNKEWLLGLSKDDAKMIALNLDLREIEDREALQFIQEILEETGATWQEQSRFMRETSLFHRERMADLFGMPDPDAALQAAGFRVNPADVADVAYDVGVSPVAEQIYGDLAHLDDEGVE